MPRVDARLVALGVVVPRLLYPAYRQRRHASREGPQREGEFHAVMRRRMHGVSHRLRLVGVMMPDMEIVAVVSVRMDNETVWWADEGKGKGDFVA